MAATPITITKRKGGYAYTKGSPTLLGALGQAQASKRKLAIVKSKTPAPVVRRSSAGLRLSPKLAEHRSAARARIRLRNAPWRARAKAKALARSAKKGAGQ